MGNDWEDMISQATDIIKEASESDEPAVFEVSDSGRLRVPRPKKATRSLIYDTKLDGYVLKSPDDEETTFWVQIDSKDFIEWKNGKAKLESIAERSCIKIPFENYIVEDEYLPSSTNHAERVWLKLVHTGSEVKFELPHGVYTLKQTQYTTFLQEFKVNTETYVDIGRSMSDVSADFANFRKSKDKYKNLGPKKLKRKYRRSCLLYGPPGTGKTTSIIQILSNAKSEGYYVIFIDSHRGILEQVHKFKAAFEDQEAMVVFVIEELTERVQSDSMEQLLTFLDGEKSWENSYTIATTNYQQELPANLIDRPGRFSLIKEVQPLNEEETFKLLVGFGLPEEEADKYKSDLKGLSIDYITFVVTEYFINGGDIKDILNQVRDERKKLSGSFKKGVGLK